MRSAIVLAALAASLPLSAQNIFHGNQVPSAYIENSPAVLGQSLFFGLGSPTVPGGFGVLSLSGGIGPTVAPVVGLVGLDVFNPFYFTQLFFLDAAGDASLTLPLAPGLGSAGDPPLFANALTIEPGLVFSFSKTVRVEWANPDGWEPVAALTTVRQNHTATALGAGPRDNVTEVLICGGMTGSIIIPAPIASAELFEPLQRTTTALPSMSLPRAGHQAVRLADGRVLLSGGVTTGGLVSSSCEFFDPAVMAFVPAPSMSVPRAGHQLTRLDDGRVLASGGITDWQNAATNLIAVLNTAQNTAEIYDPATNLWSLLPNMASKRFGHSQTLLPDGRVLVVCGIRGGTTGTNPLASPGQMPAYTSNCEVFDPATGSFTPTASLSLTSPVFPFLSAPARGFHAASLLPNGSVLVSGGLVANASGVTNGEAVSTSSCAIWDGATWASTGSLPTAASFHTQLPVAGGALVTGGFATNLALLGTTAQNVLHDGTLAIPLAPIGTDGGGTAQPRAVHSTTALHDGTFLIYGGGLWPSTRGDGWIYTPN